MSRLSDLLLDWEEHRDAGRAITPEELCAGAPELLDELRRRIAQLQQFQQIDEQVTAPDMPAQIGKYRIKRVLGAGASGIVYLAKDRDLQRKVAIKVLHHQIGLGALDRQRLAERFKREALTVAKLCHPAIVPIHGAALEGDEPYFVMEYQPGGTLQDRLRKTPPQPMGTAAECAAFWAELIGAVSHAHANGIMHRDLKPGNILLDGGGRPRVTDFGLAKLVDETLWSEDSSCGNPLAGDITLTQLGRHPGTPAYMAPEQYGQLGLVSYPVDVWALGVILYEMLTGTCPFQGTERAELRQRICKDPIVPPSAVHAQVDARLERLALRCLTRDPNRRPTAAHLARSVERYLRPGPVGRLAGAARNLWSAMARRGRRQQG